MYVYESNEKIDDLGLFQKILKNCVFFFIWFIYRHYFKAIK